MTTNTTTPTPAKILVNMPDCELKGSGGLVIPIKAGVYELTPSNPLNPHDCDLHLPDGHVTVDARVTEDGRIQIT